MMLKRSLLKLRLKRGSPQYRALFATIRAVANADVLPGPADFETTFAPGRAFVRRVQGQNLWILYRYDPRPGGQGSLDRALNIRHRLCVPREKSPLKIFAYENRMGVTYFLHQGKTKTGKARYFVAKTIGKGALAAVPDGFEISESINGVVSVRRKVDGAIVAPAEDVAVVGRILESHPHLVGYVARAVDNAIVVFEPHPRPRDLAEIAKQLGARAPSATFIKERTKHARYDPVMKFEKDGPSCVVFRMTYRGSGGWSWALQPGDLAMLAKKLVPSVGTEAFYELM